MSLRIAIVGYGRMGRAVEAEALGRGHEIIARIDRDNFDQIKALDPDTVDAVVEFTHPDVAVGVYRELIGLGLPTVTGTTGWYSERDKIKALVGEAGAAFLYASNFSIGVNILFQLNATLARLMNRYPEYDAYVEEAHHKEKKDGPSGTAIGLAEQLLDGLDRKNTWVTDELHHRPPHPEELSIGYVRAGGIIGRHKVTFTSEIDDISISHVAHNRRGFALGAVIAAEWMQGKKGFFDFREVFAG